MDEWMARKDLQILSASITFECILDCGMSFCHSCCFFDWSKLSLLRFCVWWTQAFDSVLNLSIGSQVAVSRFSHLISFPMLLTFSSNPFSWLCSDIAAPTRSVASATDFLEALPWLSWSAVESWSCISKESHSISWTCRSETDSMFLFVDDCSIVVIRWVGDSRDNSQDGRLLISRCRLIGLRIAISSLSFLPSFSLFYLFPSDEFTVQPHQTQIRAGVDEELAQEISIKNNTKDKRFSSGGLLHRRSVEQIWFVVTEQIRVE